MKKRTYLRLLAGFLILLLLALGGCQRVREPQTIRLPQEESQADSDQTDESAPYTVQHIYAKAYESLVYNGYSAFLEGCGEHQVRLLKYEEKELLKVQMDYRYGFYETEEFPEDEIKTFQVAWGMGDFEAYRMALNFFSPDGRYLIYLDWMNSYFAPTLRLLDLDTREERELLNGDLEGLSGDDYMVLAAWDPETTLLCYGFCPNNADVWVRDGGCTLYYLDLESGKLLGGVACGGDSPVTAEYNLKKTSLYVDREGEQILTALVLEDSLTFAKEVSLFSIREGDFQEAEPMTYWKEPLRLSYPSETLICLDAGLERMYDFSPYEGILIFDTSTGELLDMLPVDSEVTVTHLLALEGGNVFITSEYRSDENEQDICLYIRNEEGVAEQILYKNAGWVKRLQYDSVYHRLLCESLGWTGNGELAEGLNGEASYESQIRTATILEF